MSEPTHTKPLCPHCGERIEQLGVWIDEYQRTALCFCPACGKALSAQLLPAGLPQEDPGHA